METFAHADFAASDQKWFASNPDRYFRYHVVPPTLAVELVEGFPCPSPRRADEPPSTVVLAYRASNGGHGYCVVLVPAAVANFAVRECGDNDNLGFYWIDDCWPLLPSLTRDEVMTRSKAEEPADALAAA